MDPTFTYYLVPFHCHILIAANIVAPKRMRHLLQDSLVGLVGLEKLGVAGAEYVICALGSQTLRWVFQSVFWQLRSQ
jgi:hypothetical protein